MAEDIIRYDVLIQEALRGTVKRILSEVARVGLPGEHHFFISFGTDKPGVRISDRLRNKYPHEMTIVIQHQYENLEIYDWGFGIDLSFGGNMESLIIPFAAIQGFFDPSVQFGLQFENSTVNDYNSRDNDDIQEPQHIQEVNNQLGHDSVFSSKNLANRSPHDMNQNYDGLSVSAMPVSSKTSASKLSGDLTKSKTATFTNDKVEGLKNKHGLEEINNPKEEATNNNSDETLDDGSTVVYISNFRKKH